jgi:hypothetical protein
LPRGVACVIGIEATHHDASPGHAHSVTARRESPHTRTRSEVAQASLHSLTHPVISPHSPPRHFDVTAASPRLDEFVPPTWRFPA